MKRDFSESAKQELLSLVKQVDKEDWCGFTDWFGDRWYDFEGWIGDLDVKDYIDNINKYHEKVIDKNNTTESDINAIFENVNNVNSRYVSRFSAILSDLRGYRNSINSIAEVISPTNGRFDSQYIGTALKNSMNSYLSSSNVLVNISQDGLTQEDVQNMSESQLQAILNTLAAAIIDNSPDVEIGDKIELPIGPGVSLYYSVSAEVKGTGDIEVNFAMENQKLELKNFKYSQNFDGIEGAVGIDDEGEVSVGVGDDSSEVEFANGAIIVTNSIEVEPNTYTYKLESNFANGQFVIEKAVKTDLDGASITSEVGIKFESNNWKPLPVPVSVESPYTCQLPEFDIDWEEVLIVTGAITVVTAAGVICIATGGTVAGVVILVSETVTSAVMTSSTAIPAMGY